MRYPVVLLSLVVPALVPVGCRREATGSEPLTCVQSMLSGLDSLVAVAGPVRADVVTADSASDGLRSRVRETHAAGGVTVLRLTDSLDAGSLAALLGSLTDSDGRPIAVVCDAGADTVRRRHLADACAAAGVNNAAWVHTEVNPDSYEAYFASDPGPRYADIFCAAVSADTTSEATERRVETALAAALRAAAARNRAAAAVPLDSAAAVAVHRLAPYYRIAYYQ